MLTIERSIKIGASVVTVWELLSSQPNLRRWLEPGIEIDVSVGGKHRHISREGNQLITGEVLEIEPMRKIAFSWFEDGPDTDWVNPIRFTFTLHEIPEGTLVTFVIDGFEQIGKPTYHRTYEAYERGTERHHVLQNLRQALEPDDGDGQ